MLSQGVDERMINAHYYYYYVLHSYVGRIFSHGKQG